MPSTTESDNGVDRVMPWSSWSLARGSMLISRHLVLVSGFRGGFGLVHTTLVVVSGWLRVFQDVFQGRLLMATLDRAHR
jgi:hypothetical protein